MKKIILFFGLITCWGLLNSFTPPVSKMTPVLKDVPINFTITTANGCSIIVSGVADNQSFSASTFRGTITLSGNYPCPQGTYNIVGISLLGGGSGGTADYTLTFSHASICASATVDWGANGSSDPNIATFLNDYKSTILDEIKEDLGC